MKHLLKKAFLLLALVGGATSAWAAPATSWSDISIDLRSGQLGTSGSNLQKYLTIDGSTYNYTDAEPASYNALLKAANYNGGQHGYQNLTADIPVKAGIYKFTVGTCQYNNGAIVVKNSSNVAQTIYDEIGDSHTEFSALGTCDNSTVGSQQYHTSIWYKAEEDEIIKVFFDSYTPYFAIEQVNALPELRYAYTFVNDTEGASGTVPAAGSVLPGGSITLPVNKTLFKSGYTLTGWNDGSNTYATGASYTPTQNTTLTAVFTANTYELGENYNDVTIRWDFQTKNGCPTLALEGNTGFLVTQAEVNGSNIDVKLNIDATSGKFNNASNNDWAQVNAVTTFSFPAKDNAVVTTFSYNEPKNGDDKSSLDGNVYTSYSDNVATFSAAPTAGVSTLTVKGGSYYRYLEITYTTSCVSATIGDKGYTTFSSSYPLNLSGMTVSEGTVTAYSVLAAGVTASEVTPTVANGNVAANEGLILGGTAGATVTIPVAASGTAISGNLMVGCPAGATINSSTPDYSTIYVLVNTTQAEFQNVNNWIGASKTVTIPAGKAYLNTTVSDGARSLTISFDNLTGIDNVENGAVKSNLPTKRIVNGKLIIEKKGMMFNANGARLY